MLSNIGGWFGGLQFDLVQSCSLGEMDLAFFLEDWCWMHIVVVIREGGVPVR